MRSLRTMCGVSRKGRCRNSDVRERCGLKEGVVTRVERAVDDKNLFSWSEKHRLIDFQSSDRFEIQSDDVKRIIAYEPPNSTTTNSV
ncbi:hypothetical protein EVAR_65758_1 [Eumeta japonica]|uniref:Uncharacterized protein n=1 Tax=Eumeta variegata TaxID=151549 RepID=A0A4C1ZSA0_EUMVA|nr:hypothetical protein EVAR_65758_1 [Eumeta japonica]